ncbi:hypothetical protein [Pumilibacter muris]|uniref:hypothetical protein n=1 Tax=Pumilibacter muris TaxID=2941510 RepID=UPI002040FF2E|nr:hypothetical protein [Pumilibacter muris]
MITAKRRITTEQDRFGGYAIQPSQKITFDENLENAPLTDSDRRFDFRVNTDEPSFSATPTYSDMSNYSGGRTYAAPYSEQNAVNREQPRAAVTQQPSVIEYSTRQDYAGTTGFMQNPVATPSYTKSRRKKEDLMPSIRTRAYGQPELREAEKEEEKSRPRDKAKLSGKTKAALLIYAAVVVILAVMVIATGLAVSNINAQASALENEITVKNARIIEQNSEIARLTDPDRIVGAAVGEGMEKIKLPAEVQLIPTTEPVKYEGRTNWFDKFCDFLSKIIGG